MTFRGRNVFFLLLLVTNIFFIILYPKNVIKGMLPMEVFICICFVFFTIYFLNKITCFNLIVTWGGGGWKKWSIHYWSVWEKKLMYLCVCRHFFYFLDYSFVWFHKQFIMRKYLVLNTLCCCFNINIMLICFGYVEISWKSVWAWKWNVDCCLQNAYICCLVVCTCTSTCTCTCSSETLHFGGDNWVLGTL